MKVPVCSIKKSDALDALHYLLSEHRAAGRLIDTLKSHQFRGSISPGMPTVLADLEEAFRSAEAFIAPRISMMEVPNGTP